MPKKKRTRKQKMQSDVRHNVHQETAVAQKETMTTYSVTDVMTSSIVPSHPSKHLSHVITTSEYQYLYGDLTKTLALTTAIVAIELVIYFTKII